MKKPTHLTSFELIKLQMLFAVPFIRELQEILGEDVVINALKERAKRRVHQARNNSEAASTVSNMMSNFEAFSQGDALDIQIKEESAQQAEFEVTRCQYAELMKKLEAPDLGSLLLCSEDFPMAEREGIALERSQTIMTGAACCDFKFCLRHGANEEG